MGVFSKLKGIFYDEVVVEEDDGKELEKVNKIVKKEPKKEVVEVPKIEEVKYKTVDVPEETRDFKPLDLDKEPEKTENTFNERDLFRSDRTFNIVEFDDDEEEEKVPSRRNVLSEQNRTTRVENPTTNLDVDKPKVFKPTPVISPIWGVLDKDYKKDEIQEKNLTTDKLSSSVTSYDNVRRKAYGTLEDELEDTLNTLNTMTTDTIKEELNKTEDPAIREQKTAKIEDLISKLDAAEEEMDKTMSIEEAEEKVKLENFDEEDDEEETTVTDKTLTDSTLEHDLFNLIDSMYDDKEE